MLHHLCNIVALTLYKLTKLPLLILLFLSSGSVFGQQFSGQVISKEDHQPLPFSLIYVDEFENGVTADESGKFSFDAKGLTHVNLQISMLGYETLSIHVHLKETIHQQFELTVSHLQLDEVVISMPTGQLRSDNVVFVEQEKIQFLLENNSPSLAVAISQLPGVDQISTGSGIGKPVIRGLTGNRIITYSQGIRLENQQFGAEHGLGENAIGISNVEVIKGPASLLYGADALGGVLYLVDENFTLKDRVEGFVESNYSSNANQYQNSVGLKLNKKIKWNLFSAHNSATDYSTPNSGNVLNSRYNELSLKSSLGYNKNNWTGNLKYSYLLNNFGIPEESTLSDTQNRSMIHPYQNIAQHIISTSHSLFFGPHEITATLGFNNNRSSEILSNLLNLFRRRSRFSAGN